MKSVVTQKSYDNVELSLIDSYSLRVKSREGAWYHELSDTTWIGIDDELQGTVRYTSNQSHGGLLHLVPVYERIEDTWYCMRTGKEIPTALEKEVPKSRRP